MKRALNGRTFWLAALAMTLFVGSGVAQQSMSHAQTKEPTTPGGTAMTMKPDMMAQHQQMMAGMRMADQKLDGLVAAMNSARGGDKVDAIAAVINEMVAHQKMMHAGMMSMSGGMMMMMSGATPKDASKEK